MLYNAQYTLQKYKSVLGGSCSVREEASSLPPLLDWTLITYMFYEGAVAQYDHVAGIKFGGLSDCVARCQY